MKKNTKILISSVCAIAVLGAATGVLVLTKPQTEETSQASSEEEKTEIYSYKADDISTLTIKNEKGEFTVNREGKGKWSIDSIPEDYADNTKYESAIGDACEISYKLIAEEKPEDLNKYGFDNPTATFEMTFKDDKYEPVSCMIGIENSGENSWYFKTDLSDTVYLVSKSALSFAMGVDLDYVQLSELTDAFDKENDIVQRVRVERPDLPNDLVLDYVPANEDREFQNTYVSYKMSSHNNILADDEADMGIVYGLLGLSAKGAYAIQPDDKTKSECGFDEPSCVVTTVVNEDEVIKLTLGKAIYVTADDNTEVLDSYYGMVSGKDAIYIFDAASLEYPTVTPESILYKLFLTPYIYYLDGVTVWDKDNNEYRFDITGDADNSKVTIDGKEVSLPRFKTFYQFIIGSYAEEIYLEDIDEEVNTFVGAFEYDYRDEADGQNGKDKVEIYLSQSDRKCIFVVNGDVRYKIRSIYGEKFQSNLTALLTGEGDILTDY